MSGGGSRGHGLTEDEVQQALLSFQYAIAIGDTRISKCTGRSCVAHCHTPIDGKEKYADAVALEMHILEGMRIPPLSLCSLQAASIHDLGGCKGEGSWGEIPGKSTTMQQRQQQPSRPRQPASVTSCASGSPVQRFTCQRRAGEGPIPMHKAGRMRRMQHSGRMSSMQNRPMLAIITQLHHFPPKTNHKHPPGTLGLMANV
jgi:hypothetical protein